MYQIIEMQSVLRNRVMSMESHDCVDSPWTQLFFKKILCIFIAILGHEFTLGRHCFP
jgi:hypothetical protein